MRIDALNLAPGMRQAAIELQIAHPSVEYISGRRDLAKQAHAMACNVVTNRHFIARTYKHAAALQTALDVAGPNCKTVGQIEAVLFKTLQAMPEEELAKISDHFTANAVDLQPMEEGGVLTEEGQAVEAWIRAYPGTKWFTMREAGQVRWHWACQSSAEV